MKREPEELAIMRRMAPGELASEGFLGDDQRGLYEIIEADDVAVRSLGVTHQWIADRLADILAACTAAMGSPVDIADGRLVATWHEGMGRIPCPFGHAHMAPKGEVVLTDPASGQSFRFTPLSVHLIGEHGFYQGRPSRYRLDPDTLCRLLGSP